MDRKEEAAGTTLRQGRQRRDGELVYPYYNAAAPDCQEAKMRQARRTAEYLAARGDYDAAAEALTLFYRLKRQIEAQP